jgi:hypothetical protein
MDCVSVLSKIGNYQSKPTSQREYQNVHFFHL